MPTSIYKLLIHGTEIVSFAILPIGQLSEESQEALNKYIKEYRRNFSRKSSRTNTMKDVFLRLLVASDPFITNMRKLPPPQKNKKFISRSCKFIRAAPNVESESEYSTSESTIAIPMIMNFVINYILTIF